MTPHEIPLPLFFLLAAIASGMIGFMLAFFAGLSCFLLHWIHEELLGDDPNYERAFSAFAILMSFITFTFIVTKKFF